MKTPLLVSVLSLTIFALGQTVGFKPAHALTILLPIADSDYCEGWKDGYCEGWKDVKGQFAICPISPICPIPKIECSEGYRCGYNRGFKAGFGAANKN